MSDLEDVLDIELSDEEYDTIAGLVIQLLDRVPEEKERPIVHYKNIDIKVLRMEERAISKVMIHVNKPVPDNDGDPDSASGHEDDAKED